MHPLQRFHVALMVSAAIALARPAHTQSRTPRPAPTRSQLDALATLEGEVREFSRRAEGFRSAMRQAVEGRHQRELAAIRLRFERQIANERSLEAQARRRAIEAFERFVLQYPSEAQHTPDVLLRLSELYFDEARYTRLAQDEALDAERSQREQRGQSTDDLREPPPTDYRCSILAYRHMVQRFERDPRRDAALYLLGWTLGELGHEDEAASARRALVCAGRAQYAPSLDLRQPLAARAPAVLRCDSFARALEAHASVMAPRPATSTASLSPSDYAQCNALAGANGQTSRYAAEVWYAIGDQHFDDAGDTNANSLAAIAAYTRSAQLSDGTEPSSRGPFWARAQYKIGWSHFRRDGGYSEAIRAFSALLDHADVARDPIADGLRSDALRWVGVILSESLWNASLRHGDPEQEQCQSLVERLAGPSRDAVRPFDCAGLVRMQSVLAEQRRWRAEAWLELADNYFLQTKYYEAIAGYRLFLQRYATHPSAVRATARVGEALRRLGLRAQANQSDASLAQFLEDSPWMRANANDPSTLARAERLARDALRSAAIDEHQRARAMRARSATITDDRERARALSEARAAYVSAAALYQSFVDRFANEEAAEELAFNRADALFWAARYEDAARAYEQIRDRADGNPYVPSAAYMATVARSNLVTEALAARSVSVCEAQRAGVATAAHAECPFAATAPRREMSAVVRALFDAREAYRRVVSVESDSRRGLSMVSFDGAAQGGAPPFRAVFLYRNAMTLLWNGLADEGELALRALVDGECEVSPEVRQFAAVELAESLQRRGRPVSPSALIERATAQRGCRTSVTPALAQLQQRSTMRLARAAFDEAMRSGDDRSVPRYREAARLYALVARSSADDGDVFVARYMQALCLDRAGEPARSTALHESNLRAIDALSSARRAALARSEPGADSIDAVLVQTLFRLAEARTRSLDDDEALRLYERALREPSSARSTLESGHPSNAQEALRAIATIHRHRLAWREAARASAQLAALTADPAQRAQALFESADASAHAGPAEHALRVWTEYRSRVLLDGASAGLHLRAQRAIVDALTEARRDHEAQQARDRLVELYRAHPSSEHAPLVAGAMIAPIERELAALTAAPLREATGEELAVQVRARARAVASIEERVRAAIEYRAAEPSVAALEASGRAHEWLAVQLARVGALVRLSPAQERSLAQVEAQATRLDRIAASIVRADRAQAERVRARADEVRERVRVLREGATSAVQARFDRESEAERTLAVQSFVAAAQLARRSGLSSTAAARAVERLRLEENRSLIDRAVQTMAPALRAGLSIHEQTGRSLVAVESAGVSVIAGSEGATPGLAR